MGEIHWAAIIFGTIWGIGFAYGCVWIIKILIFLFSDDEDDEDLYLGPDDEDDWRF